MSATLVLYGSTDQVLKHMCKHNLVIAVADEDIPRLHARMPIIIKPEYNHEWLNAKLSIVGDSVIAGDYAAIDHTLDKVSVCVNNPGNQGVMCIRCI